MPLTISQWVRRILYCDRARFSLKLLDHHCWSLSYWSPSLKSLVRNKSQRSPFPPSPLCGQPLIYLLPLQFHHSLPLPILPFYFPAIQFLPAISFLHQNALSHIRFSCKPSIWDLDIWCNSVCMVEPVHAGCQCLEGNKLWYRLSLDRGGHHTATATTCLFILSYLSLPHLPILYQSCIYPQSAAPYLVLPFQHNAHFSSIWTFPLLLSSRVWSLVTQILTLVTSLFLFMHHMDHENAMFSSKTGPPLNANDGLLWVEFCTKRAIRKLWRWEGPLATSN